MGKAPTRLPMGTNTSVNSRTENGMDKGLHMQLMDQKYLRGDGLTVNFWSQLRTGGCNLGSNSRADPAPGVESRSRKRITDSSFRSVRRYCVR